MAKALTLKDVAGRAPSIINRLVRDRTQVDWVTPPNPHSNPSYKMMQDRYKDDPELFDLQFKRDQEKFKEVNEDIHDQVKPMVSRALKFMKQAIPVLKELGYTLTVGKPSYKKDSKWAEYY